MAPIRLKTIYTVLIAFAVTGTLPVGAYFLFHGLLTRVVTRTNAGDVFDLFQEVLNKGDVVIHDSTTAAMVTERAYHDKVAGPPIDGWSNIMRISAVVQGNSCQMTILSAGPDGRFGNADDMSFQRSFDISVKKKAN